MSMAMEKEETEQTFDFFCTFILYSDIIAEENKGGKCTYSTTWTHTCISDNE